MNLSFRRISRLLPFFIFHFSLFIAVSAPAETVQIASAADLAAFANRVNAGETELCAEMTADVSLGNDAPRVGSSHYFGGIFDGKEHTLTVAF